MTSRIGCLFDASRPVPARTAAPCCAKSALGLKQQATAIAQATQCKKFFLSIVTNSSPRQKATNSGSGSSAADGAGPREDTGGLTRPNRPTTTTNNGQREITSQLDPGATSSQRTLATRGPMSYSSPPR